MNQLQIYKSRAMHGTAMESHTRHVIIIQ